MTVSKEKGRGSVTFLLLLFFTLLQLKIRDIPMCHIWGYHILNPNNRMDG